MPSTSASTAEATARLTGSRAFDRFTGPQIRKSAALLAWIWVTIEVINGVDHPLWSLRLGGYTPGVVTAQVLLVVALYLGRQLRTIARHSSTPV